MKKAGLLLLMLAAVCFQGLAQTAKIKSCSIAPDNDDDMLTVKVSFDISGCQGEEGRVNVYFYNNATGKALKCYDHTYNTTDNCVATWATITPKYQSTSTPIWKSRFRQVSCTLPMERITCITTWR